MSTNRQTQVLDFIKKHKDQYGEFPTLSEISSGLGLKSVSTIHSHLSKLVGQGFLEKSENYQGYELSDNRPRSDKVPIVGTITAGQPIEAIEEVDQEQVAVAGLPASGTFYALKVKGDSMIDEGIFDGDTVVIKKQTSAQNGQTVVAVIDDNRATLKKLYRDGNRFKLQPANQKLLPLFRNEVEVRGVVWSVRRNYKQDDDKEDQLRTKTWRTLDLFAGIGGIRIGFENEGFKTVFANDFDDKCKYTYDMNFKDSKLVVEDITKIKVDDLPEFDFLLGGFPCQAFSIAGYRHGFDDKKGRGNLFFDIARIIEARKPEGFLLENVKNLKSHDGGNTFKVIEETLKDLGYSIKHKIMNSMEYGNVPQNRERIYIVGFKDHNKTEAFEFPDPIKLEKSIKDILEKKVDEKYYYNGKPLYEKIKDDVTEQNEVYQWRRKYVRKNKKGVCPTLTANMGMGGHNVPIIFDGKGIRKLTPKECLRIQGYPKNYVLPDIADSALYKQVGNSVTVPVIKRIAKQMLKVL
ncbi:MAG TPA: transcriptional repressor LexA [Candidatus Saccharibacteria bacterium]|nr:transcriptional repressor LexA [Candidatus Saccharibacteria bacterium]